MNSLNILISKLPEKLKEPVIHCDSNKVLSVTMNEDYLNFAKERLKELK